MWVEPPAFRQYMESLTRNLTSHGIDRVIYVNAHGGNVPTCARSEHAFGRTKSRMPSSGCGTTRSRNSSTTCSNRTAPRRSEGDCADPVPRAELVHDDRLEKARDTGIPDVEAAETVKHGSRTFYDAADNTTNGVLGDQTDATAAKGEKLFEAASDQLVQLCEWLAAQEFEDLLPREHV